jgi:hypothetical protein
MKRVVGMSVVVVGLVFAGQLASAQESSASSGRAEVSAFPGGGIVFTESSPDYALIVKDKVYTLKTSSDATKEQLDKLAGQAAKIRGDLNGDTIAVTSVQAAK